MGLFTPKSRAPRSFSHKYMYVNERKERLKKLEERAKRELGMVSDEGYNPNEMRGTFVKATKHLRRRKESERKPITFGVALLFIGVLLLLWYFLQTGKLNF